MSELHVESLVVSAGRPHEPGAPLNAPIVLAAPYRNDPSDNHYSRAHPTETRAALESALGALDGGSALTFASGMAAIAAVAEGQPSGTVAVVPQAAYSGAVSIFNNEQALGRMTVRPVDVGDTDAVIAALDGAGLLWLEAVTNPLLAVPDLPRLIEAAHQAGAVVGVDATFATPLNVRPLELGADIVMHSATKYLAGHSDLLLGVLVTRSSELRCATRDPADADGRDPRCARIVSGSARAAHACAAHGARAVQRARARATAGGAPARGAGALPRPAVRSRSTRWPRACSTATAR